MNNVSRMKLSSSLYVTAFLCLTLFFFGPAHLYYTNIFEQSSSFSTLFAYLLIPLLFFLAMVTSVLLLFPPPVHEKSVSVVFMLSALLWLQGNVIVWNYGLLDGTDINWNSKVAYGFIDGFLWIFLLGVALTKSARIFRIARKGSIAFILIQVISFSVIVSRAPDISRYRNANTLDKQSVFRFSPKRNVLLVILDSFRGDVFEKIITQEPAFRDILDGFTYYRNSTGTYQGTVASVPLILTGQYYENSEPIREFIERVFSDHSLPKMLLQEGYQVDLIGGRGIYADKTIASTRCEVTDLTRQDTGFHEAATLLDVTLFRYLPHFLKICVYNDNSWLLSNVGFGGFPPGFHRDSIEIIEEMARRATADNEKYTFKYLHLMIPHPPIRLDENLEYSEMQLNYENYMRQAQGSLRLIDELFKKLKQLGIFENTMIFVLADHGFSRWAPGSGEDYTGGFPSIETIKWDMYPLFLVKRFGTAQKLTISDAPVALADVAETIVSELDMEVVFPGTSLVTISETSDRARRCLPHEWEARENTFFLPPMKEYLISGQVSSNESWQPTGRVFTASGLRYSTSKHPD